MARKRKTITTTTPLKNHDLVPDLKLIVTAKTKEQKNMLKVIEENTITFVQGPAGSGKTFVTIAYALQQLFQKKYDKIVLSRPVIEAAGERLGFLPGDMNDKIDPYMMPLFDAFLQKIPPDLLKKMLNTNGTESKICTLPLAFMRGVTFRNSFVVADECQNATKEQIRMLLTRIGEKSKMVICGDIKQSDIEHRNGLVDAFERLQNIDGVGFVTLTKASIIRHPIIQKIEERYDNEMV